MFHSITEKEFTKFRTLIYELAGINLSDAKRALVVSRLSKRLRHHNLSTFGEYYDLVNNKDGVEERQVMVDLMTTNETYFFREPKHFDYLGEFAAKPEHRQRNFRVWSAACSSGEEPYSIAMTLANVLGSNPWEIVATDISTRILARARQGLYPLDAAEKIPKEYLSRYCLKGVRSQAGYLLVSDGLRSRVSFRQLNLHGTWPDLGLFDVIFLRNVMIYFDMPTKQRLLTRLWNHLKPGGMLYIGHSETLNRVSGDFRVVVPAVYQK